MSGTSVMRATLTLPPFISSVVAAPYPECDPCAAAIQLDLEALSIAGKYLCCDLTCDFKSSVGCAITVLPENCRACDDGADNLAYDEPPIDRSTDSSTPAPTEGAAIVFLTSAPTEGAPTILPTPAPTEGAATISPTSAPTEGILETQLPVDHDDDSSYSPMFEVTPSPSAVSCTACDPASAVLTADNWRAIADAGYELVCDPECYVSSTLDGCGVFGLDLGCRAVRVGDRSDDESSSAGTDFFTSSPIESCSADEEARCADISSAQQEALDSYDNGGKVIVCDPTCIDGVSDPIHCNYFGLGPLCRGCGACSSCTPCP